MSLGLSSCVNLKKSYCPLSCRSCLLRLAWDPAVCPLALWCSFLVSAACLGVFPVVVPVPLPLHVRARTAWLKSKVGGLLAVGFRWQAVCFYLCTSCSCQCPHTTMCHYPNVCVCVCVCLSIAGLFQKSCTKALPLWSSKLQACWYPKYLSQEESFHWMPFQPPQPGCQVPPPPLRIQQKQRQLWLVFLKSFRYLVLLWVAWMICWTASLDFSSW